MVELVLALFERTKELLDLAFDATDPKGLQGFF